MTSRLWSLVLSQSDLDWNGFNLVPRVLFNMKFN